MGCPIQALPPTLYDQNPLHLNGPPVHRLKRFALDLPPGVSLLGNMSGLRLSTRMAWSQAICFTPLLSVLQSHGCDPHRITSQMMV